MDRDSNLGSQVPESESREGPGHQRGNRRKVEKDNPSSIKKRARDIERLLNKKGDGLPADTRINLQRELAAHWERIHQHEDKKKRAKMISRYHQVRFFERQKADRLVKKLRKQLIEATNSNEISTLKNELHVAEVDADYARHFPLLERYVSLYPQTISGKEQRPGEAGDGQDGSGKDPEDRFDAQGMAEVALHAPRPPLWATIEKIREEGRGALEKLRDRRTDIKPKRSQSERKSKEILARKSDVTQVKRTKQTYASEQTSALSNRASRRADRDQQHRRHANPQAARHGGTTGGDSDGDGFFEAA